MKLDIQEESLFDILLRDSKWIDVNDKLPQTNDLVLTYSGDIMGHKHRLLVPNLNSKSTFPSSVTHWKKITSP
jgi:hypothetical protein